MGKMTMGPTSEKSQKSRVVEPEPRVVEKMVEVEKVVEKEVPVYVEKEVPIHTEKIIKEVDNTILEEMNDKMTQHYVLTEERLSSMEERIKKLTAECPEKHEKARKRLEELEASIAIHDKTLVHIRQIQASEEGMYRSLKSKMDKSLKYNKYCMIGIVISISLAILASII